MESALRNTARTPRPTPRHVVEPVVSDELARGVLGPRLLVVVRTEVTVIPPVEPRCRRTVLCGVAARCTRSNSMGTSSPTSDVRHLRQRCSCLVCVDDGALRPQCIYPRVRRHRHAHRRDDDRRHVRHQHRSQCNGPGILKSVAPLCQRGGLRAADARASPGAVADCRGRDVRRDRHSAGGGQLRVSRNGS